MKWWEVNTWDFQECSCATPEYINTYFNQQRFFDRLEYMDWAKEILDELKDSYDITIVSSGYSPNLKAKEKWINKHLPYCKFIGVNLKEYKDKSHIDMSDGVFIDDSMHNLIASNALINICFGEEYEWNKNWAGFKCTNWTDIKNFLDKINIKGSESMSDITMCTSKYCPKREVCYRAQTEFDVYQSLSNFEYTCNENSGFCDFILMKHFD